MEVITTYLGYKNRFLVENEFLQITISLQLVSLSTASDSSKYIDQEKFNLTCIEVLVGNE